MIELPTSPALDLATVFPGDGGDRPSPGLLQLGAAVARLENADSQRQLLLDAVLALVSGERGFLIVREAEAWRVLAARTFDGEEIRNPEEKLIEPVIGTCFERREGFFTADLEEESVIDALKRGRQPRTRSLLILPFPDREQMLYVDHRFQSLELGAANSLELAWLYTLLFALERGRLAEATHAALTDELRQARRTLKERRKGGGAAAPRSASAAPLENEARDPRGLRGDFSSIIGESSQIIEILRLLDRVAPTNAPLLINGQSGTGKELVAHAIHLNSSRRDAPFVSENCGALTETLLESELFGYVKGAFTGAYEDREGLFEVADGGTLFLDEIGDTSPGLQKKLLRVLQEGQIRRVGGSGLIPVDVRIVSATNKDLMSEVRGGRFREDLFYRLNVINVLLPTLRERIEDLPLLAEHFVRRLNQENGVTKTLNPELLAALSAHIWPGNIRELQNEVRRVYTLSEDRLDPQMLSPRVLRRGEAPDQESTVLDLDRVLELGSLKNATEELERHVLKASLRRFHGNKAQVCAELQIPKTTLYTKLRKYDLE